MSGYVHRSDPSTVLRFARSGMHANAISERLASTSIQTRFLGLVVGTAISRLVDAPESRMNFRVPEMDSKVAEWYLSLTAVEDNIGNVKNMVAALSTCAIEPQTRKPSKIIEIPPKAVVISDTPANIIEIVEEEEDGLPSHEKVDQDPEDEDDDPTTVRRNRPIAPV